ncbi:S8 family peptidase [bacterium]|nr:S8 family peptidase [bacterium]
MSPSNMSLGITTVDIFDPLNTCLGAHRPWSDAIARLTASGVAVVAAAGNVTSQASGLAFPARLPNVVSVAASDKNFQVASYSLYESGPTKLASIVAPGGDLAGAIDPTPDPCQLNTAGGGAVCASTKNNTGARELRSGTSMSAPVVAGLIVRLVDRFPNKSGRDIAQLFQDTGVPFVFATSLPAIPRIAPLAAFKQASVPQNITSNAIGGSCTSSQINGAAPQIMQATGYKYRTAANVAGLASAPVTTLSNITNQTITVPSGHTQVQILASDLQGDGAWSDPVVIRRAPCAPPTITFAGPYQCGDTTFVNCYQASWAANAEAQRYETEFGPNFVGAPAGSVTQNSVNVPLTGTMRLRSCNEACGPWGSVVSISGGVGQ